MNNIIYNIHSLDKTIGELKFYELNPQLRKLNYSNPVSLYCDYVNFMPIVPCSNRIAVLVKRKYKWYN